MVYCGEFLTNIVLKNGGGGGKKIHECEKIQIQ